MFAICIECSNARGMGHLFRAINFISFLKKMNEEYLIILNDDEVAKEVLKREGIADYVIVDLYDFDSNWERKIIKEYKIDTWLNDRMSTSSISACHVKDENVNLYTIDDLGDGAGLALGNFASLIFDDNIRIPGEKVYKGLDYLILNNEIDIYKRRRDKIEKIAITLGGSDTYGVTLLVLDYIIRNKPFDQSTDIAVVLGPNTTIYEDVVRKIGGTKINLFCGVPSLISFLYDYDLAFTGGGVTAIEAAAMGLPTIITANEKHEIQIGEYLAKLGCASFAGYYEGANYDDIVKGLSNTTLAKMSEHGLGLNLAKGAENIYNIIKSGK